MYDGPGIYRHYKGGHYDVLGLGEHESSSAKLVVYRSLDVDHEVERRKAGVGFVLRPLDEHDLVSKHYDKDPFNRPVSSDEGWVMNDGSTVHELDRFVKIA